VLLLKPRESSRRPSRPKNSDGLRRFLPVRGTGTVKDSGSRRLGDGKKLGSYSTQEVFSNVSFR